MRGILGLENALVQSQRLSFYNTQGYLMSCSEEDKVL